MIFKNGSDTPINAGSPTLPNMASALNNWLINMIFGIVGKVVNSTFEVTETETDIEFKGVWQPFTSQQLMLKPEGQRAWKWFTVHALVQLKLEPDMVVKYLAQQYRVMEVRNYMEYGYMEYHLVQDYTGSGPTVNP